MLPRLATDFWAQVIFQLQCPEQLGLQACATEPRWIHLPMSFSVTLMDLTLPTPLKRKLPMPRNDLVPKRLG